MQHIALWSYTHIPNIIDLSGKSKMLWPRQENTIQKQLFDLEVKVTQRSLRYVTHCLMVMHGSVNLLGPNFKYVSKLQLKHMKLGRTVLDT